MLTKPLQNPRLRHRDAVLARLAAHPVISVWTMPQAFVRLRAPLIQPVYFARPSAVRRCGQYSSHHSTSARDMVDH